MTEELVRMARTVALNVRTLREAQRPKMSQERLAREIGMSRQTIFDIEHATRMADWSTLGLVAGALGVELLELLTLPGEQVTLDQLSRLERATADAA